MLAILLVTLACFAVAWHIWLSWQEKVEALGAKCAEVHEGLVKAGLVSWEDREATDPEGVAIDKALFDLKTAYREARKVVAGKFSWLRREDKRQLTAAIKEMTAGIRLLRQRGLVPWPIEYYIQVDLFYHCLR